MLQELHFVADSFQQEVNLQPRCSLSSNSVGIYQYVVTVAWLVLKNCEAVWLAGDLFLFTSSATGNDPRLLAGVPPTDANNTEAAPSTLASSVIY